MTVMEISGHEPVAEEIRSQLARKRWGHAELASRIGMSRQALGRRMNGEVAFRLDEIDRIAAALQVPATQLLGHGQI